MKFVTVIKMLIAITIYVLLTVDNSLQASILILNRQKFFTCAELAQCQLKCPKNIRKND